MEPAINLSEFEELSDLAKLRLLMCKVRLKSLKRILEISLSRRRIGRLMLCFSSFHCDALLN